ncbi:MAG: methyl-accepting chemotaxis protein [Oscillospiraceae bacterium]|jgi:methyl-accepting chemotaxis protein|nr:methyl-accepting chemotaxis protein [Oscillospiraceae bacterium]
MKMRLKILIPFIATVVVGTCMVLFLCVQKFNSYAKSEILNSVNQMSAVIQQELQILSDDSKDYATILASDVEFIDVVERGIDSQNFDKLRSFADNYIKVSGTGYLNITYPDRTLIYSTASPELAGKNMSEGNPGFDAINDFIAFTNVEHGEVIKIGIGTVAPLKNLQGEIIALFGVGYRLDEPSFVDEMKLITGQEVTMFQGDTRVSTTVLNDEGKRAVGTQAAANVANQVLGGKSYDGEAIVAGHPSFVHYEPILDTVSKEVVGMAFNGTYTEVMDAETHSMLVLGVGVAVIVIFASVIVAFLLARTIVRPVNEVGSIMKSLRQGDLSVRISESKSKDELAVMTNDISHFVSTLNGIIGDLTEGMRALAKRDLNYSGDADYVGDFGIIKDAYYQIQSDLNVILHEIKGATSDVNDNATQLSEMSSQLSHSASNEAATIQLITESMSEISGKTQNNMNMAREAANLSDNIKKNAEKGSTQMFEMTKAVDEINEASQNISKVIKVIDDIAFQTNILALNAAVEAARAGEAGKGFAVVADEVRSLASKSAAAAKETGELIENSMKKAEIGSQIANETAASLSDIVNGINESSVLISKIAESSEEQNQSISQIGTSVSQVADVVSRNSATAQESASFSEELNGLSVKLDDQLKSFRLN